jgi:aminopeptidase N
MSDIHYWSLRGIFPDGFEMKSTIGYAGNSENSFEFDLLQEGDDSLTMMWRPTPDVDWVEYPHQQKLDFGNAGFFRLNPMLPGDYAYANADFPVSTTEILEEATIVVYPNPSTDIVYLKGKIKEAGELNLILTDLTGKQILSKTVTAQGNYFIESMDVKSLPFGIYQLQIANAVGELILTEKITISK